MYVIRRTCLFFFSSPTYWRRRDFLNETHCFSFSELSLGFEFGDSETPISFQPEEAPKKQKDEEGAVFLRFLFTSTYGVHSRRLSKI